MACGMHLIREPLLLVLPFLILAAIIPSAAVLSAYEMALSASVVALPISNGSELNQLPYLSET